MATEKKETVIQTVTMDDGRIVEFAGKKRMIKTESAVNNTLKVQLDFVNGETRTYTVQPELLTKFALHGASQKLGDEIAGVDDVEDAVEAIDQLLIRLEKGEWNIKRAAGSGLAGSSILVRALVELTGKTVAQIRETLSSKTMEEKMALRRNSKLRPIIEKLEALKASRKEKKTGVDGEALLEGFLSETADPSSVVGDPAEQPQA